MNLACYSKWFPVLISVIAMNAHAELPEWLSGKVLLSDYESIGPARSTRSDGGTLQSALTVSANAEPEISENVGAKVSLRGTAFHRSLEKGREGYLAGEVDELWVSHSRGGLDLSVGQIQTSWGRSDALNPTDFLTAKDLTFLSTAEALRVQGAPGMRLSFVPNAGVSPIEVTLAWNARYPQTKMLIPSNGIPAGITVETDANTPAFFQDSQEWALKLAYLQPSYDFSISGFSGRNHFGQFTLQGNQVGLTFERTRALGADFSITFQDFVLRGESAYFFYESGGPGGAGFSLTEPDHWDTVLGVERAIGANFRVIVQGIYRVHPKLQDWETYVGNSPTETAISRGLGRANALIQNYQEKSETGATVLVGYENTDRTWDVKIAALGNFIGGDFAIRPRVRRELRESLHATLGMDYYGGPAEKTLGALTDYRSAFVEIDMNF